MTKAELNKQKALLETKQTELAGGLRNREGIAIEKTADTMDEVQLAGERELAIRNLDRESNLLRNVRLALSPKRLNAVPWTAYCIKCQEAADRHEFETVESFSQLLADAA
jgi:DnaK suppressor protein